MDGILSKVAILATPGSGRGTDTDRELAGAIAGNINEVLVRGQAIERRQELVRFRKQLVVEILLDLQEHVVDAERIVMHGAVEVGKIGLLARESFEYAEQFGGI